LEVNKMKKTIPVIHPDDALYFKKLGLNKDEIMQ
jgi:hypothetical protein